MLRSDVTRRQAVPGRWGAVATGHPLATAAGLRVLFEGGNAVDAAVAAAGVLSVVRPDMCGLGGDAFALVFDPRTLRVSALNGSGRAPVVLGDLLQVRPPEHFGPSLPLPGAVQTWSDLLDRFGTRSLGVLLGQAIESAAAGFPVGVRLAAQVARIRMSSRVFRRHCGSPTDGAHFLRLCVRT